MEQNRAFGDIACVLFMLFLLAVVLVWDGLARRHLRFTFFSTRTDVHIRGWKAVVIGILGIGLAVTAIFGGINLMTQINANCHQMLGCVAASLLIAPFSSVVIAFLTFITAAMFLGWAIGALDMDGPYQRALLAPGVVRSDKEIVRRVSRRLREAELSPIPSDTIVRMPTYTRHSLGVLGLASIGQRRSAHEIRDEVIASAMREHRHELQSITVEAQDIVFSTIVDYYQELSARVAQVYPWRRPRQHMSQ